jgi:hypothetical protein
MFLDLAYHIVVLHIVPDYTKWSVLEFIFVFSYTYVRNPVWIETTMWLVLLYISHSVIHRKLQNVVYMTKIDVQKKRGGAIRGTKWSSVHTYLCSVWSNVIVDCMEKWSKFLVCVLNISTQIEMTMWLIYGI